MKRILIGYSNTAGLSSRYKKAFEQIGYKADFYSFSNHPYGYLSDKILKSFNNKYLNYIFRFAYSVKFILRYDYFILISGNHLFSNFFDIKLYKFFKKKTMAVFVGCDVQQPELIMSMPNIKFSACHNCSKEYMNFVLCEPKTKKNHTKMIEKYFDVIICHYMYSYSLTRKFKHLIVPINLDEIVKYRNVKTTFNNNLPVILHAPSNAQYKGTNHLLKAINLLKDNGFVFEFRQVQNVPIEKLYEEISNADIVVDQLIQGWFGLLPVEAMAIGKPVICYMQEDLLAKLPNECPIINANPDTIYSVLKFCLENKQFLDKQSKLGMKYAEEYHDAKKVVNSLISYFEEKK